MTERGIVNLLPLCKEPLWTFLCLYIKKIL